MTGTAATESQEFESIYKLKVTVVPTNKPMIRKVFALYYCDDHLNHCKKLRICLSSFPLNLIFCERLTLLLSLQDDSDVVFRATNGKWRAVLVEISRMNKVGRPVLVGTTSVEQSESLSEQLREAGIPHEVFLLVSLTIVNPLVSIQECCPWCSVLTENFLFIIIDLSSSLVWNDYISSFNTLLCT